MEKNMENTIEGLGFRVWGIGVLSLALRGLSPLNNGVKWQRGLEHEKTLGLCRGLCDGRAWSQCTRMRIWGGFKLSYVGVMRTLNPKP